MVSWRNITMSKGDHSPSIWVEYESDKKSSLYPVEFVIIGYLTSAYHWSIVAMIKRVISVLYEFLPL